MFECIENSKIIFKKRFYLIKFVINMKTHILIMKVYFCLWAYGQELSGVIKYRFTEYHYGIIRDIPCFLYFSPQKSLFDYDKVSYMEAKDSLEVSVSLGDRPTKRKRDTYGQMYLTDKTKGELYFREFIYRNVYISHEKIPVIPWQLKNEVKTIAGYVCKKAEATFRGRKYTAWYTPSIPVSTGPWKLQGLPGAILEAESEDREVKFVVESINIPASVEKELSIEKLPEGKEVTYEEYLKSFEKERKEATQHIILLMSAIQEKAKQDGMLPKDVPVLSPENVKGGQMFTIEKHQ